MVCIHKMKYSVSSVARSCSTHCNPMDCSTPGFPVHHQLPELIQTHGHWVSDAIQLSHPSVVPFSHLQSFSASESFQKCQFFASGGQSIGVSSSASVLPINIQDWFPLGWTSWILLEVQGTLKSLLQHPNSKASILQHLTFFIVQLSHPYMTTGKIIALTRWTFADRVMSLLFNMLSSLVITSLPRSKHLLISWLQSPSAVILEPRKIKSATVSTVPNPDSIPAHYCLSQHSCCGLDEEGPGIRAESVIVCLEVRDLRKERLAYHVKVQAKLLYKRGPKM